MVIKKRCNDAVMGVFPSDHYIKNVDEFQKSAKLLPADIANSTEKLGNYGN
jgi:mannose-1-phosphate guanylyltransferase